MTFHWPFRRAKRSAHIIFLLHLDDVSTLRMRYEVDGTYTVEVTEKVGDMEVRQASQDRMTLFDACLWLGVTMGLHAGEYRAMHGENPPYLSKLHDRLRCVTTHKEPTDDSC